ncbi:MAG: GNAT family N-acetyltransferase [Candidatus Thorarchaeota archaeon]
MEKIHPPVISEIEEGIMMHFHTRPWNQASDQAFFDHCQIESFKTTLPNVESLSDDEIRQKYQEFDANDPIDMSSLNHMVFIGETPEGHPAGLIWVCHRAPFWRYKEPLTWIYNLHILPKFRRQGLAKLLLETIENWTHEEGLHVIALHVLDDNQAARALYESCGYTLVETHKESCFYEKALPSSNENKS